MSPEHVTAHRHRCEGALALARAAAIIVRKSLYLAADRPVSTLSPTPPAKLIRVALIEDDARFSAAFVQALSGAPDMRAAGSAATLRDGLALLQRSDPADILVVDLGLPDGSGIDAIRAARAAWPRCEVMVATVFGDEAHVLQSIAAGATGYLLKDSSAADIVSELRSLHLGGSPMSPLIARQVLMRLRTPAPEAPARTTPVAPALPAGGPVPAALSPREYQVLTDIMKGFSHDEIAQRLGVSRHTLLTYVRRIYVKLDVHSKVEAINAARTRGLIDHD